jgi:hypothetical protein
MSQRALRPGETHDGGTIAYTLRQHLNAAVRELRKAEDLARAELPKWPTADRVRSIYEQITADLLEGTTSVAPIAQRLSTAMQALEAADALDFDLLQVGLDHYAGTCPGVQLGRVAAAKRALDHYRAARQRLTELQDSD